jgi:uncharacterized membrane protein YhaH (DUF805 family)
MHFVAEYWWLWLILSVATLLYGGYNQISRMKGMMRGEDVFSKGLVPLFIAAVLHFGFLVLLVVAIVLNVIDYAKN